MDDSVNLVMGELQLEPLQSHSTPLSSKNRMVMYLCSMMCLECEISNTAVIIRLAFGMFGLVYGVLKILVNVAGMQSIPCFFPLWWAGNAGGNGFLDRFFV